jgi:hypothetical protein
MQATWLASSGLSHLDTLKAVCPAVHVLREQHRMHPDICSLVSAYQYDNKLYTAESVADRTFQLPAILEAQPRSIWYVLDEDGDEKHLIRQSVVLGTVAGGAPRLDGSSKNSSLIPTFVVFKDSLSPHSWHNRARFAVSSQRRDSTPGPLQRFTASKGRRPIL